MFCLFTPFSIFNRLTIGLSVLLCLMISDYHFWYLPTLDPCVVCPSEIDDLCLPLLVSSNCWPLCCLSFCDWRSLVTPFGIFKLLILALSVLLWLTVSDDPFWFLQTFGPCVVCPPVIDGLWLPFLVSSNCWPLCCLSFCDWLSLITPFSFFKRLALVFSVPL